MDPHRVYKKGFIPCFTSENSLRWRSLTVQFVCSFTSLDSTDSIHTENNIFFTYTVILPPYGEYVLWLLGCHLSIYSTT